MKNCFEALTNDHTGVDDAWVDYKGINCITVTETLG